jgi:hypothetical protein
MESAIIKRCIWISNAIGFEAIQLCKVFDHYGKISHVEFAESDHGEVLILYVDQESATKALAFDGKSVKGNVLRVKCPTEIQFESVAHAISSFEAKPPDFLSLMQNVDIGMQKEILGLLQSKQSGGAQSGASGVSTLTDHDRDMPKLYSYVENVSNNVPNDRIANQNVPKLYPYVPRISQFSGNDEKSDVSYAQWRHEVKSLLAENQSQGSIAQAIRRSLKGSAFEVLMNLDTNVPIQEIIDKFDISFGTALSVEALLQEFYEARQKRIETITDWSCRVESMIRKLKEKGSISTAGTDMARTKFFTGLACDKIKMGVRHKFENNVSYVELLKAARSLEQENKVSSTIVQTQHSSVSSNDKDLVVISKIDKVLSKFDIVDARLTKLEKHVFGNDDISCTIDKTCNYCKKSGHIISECRKLQYKNSHRYQNQGNDFVSTPRGKSLTQNNAPKYS